LATPAVTFWLWLVVQPARVAMLCPKECMCEAGGYQVFCNDSSLTAVPLIHLTDVRSLWFYENKITLLKKDSFVSLAELNSLYVIACGLRTIELRAFNGLTKLTRLFIIYNEISEIIPDIFENMNSLEYLGLRSNRLEYLNSDVFSGMVNLVYIDLSLNNLQYLHPDTFFGLPNLQNLLLSFNPHLQIPTDRPFINSHSLSYLDISRCNVSSLSVGTFANVSALEWLDLSDNNLRTVDINILRALPKLSALYLDGNPLHCDCQLQEVWRWCEDRNIQSKKYIWAPECDTPSEVKGLWWDVLEKGPCLEGNIQYYGDYNSTGYSYTDTDRTYLYEYDVEFYQLYQVPVYVLPFIFGTITNVILLIIIICNKDMRTVPNMYIINLAISNIFHLTVFFSAAFANRISKTWLHGEFMCRFFPFCRRMSVGLSAYSLIVFIIQRYGVSMNIFQVRFSSQATWRVSVATICGVWIVAVLFAVPSGISKYLCEEILLPKHITYHKLVVIFELLVSFVLPLCVVAFCYVMTVRHLVESYRHLSEGEQNPQLNTRRNTTKIVLGLAVLFVISYMPYHVFWTYFVWTEGEEYFVLSFIDSHLHWNNKSRYIYLISTCFLLINSCLNPVALFCTSSPFRQHLKRYLTCCCKTNSPPTDLELRRRN